MVLKKVWILGSKTMVNVTFIEFSLQKQMHFDALQLMNITFRVS